MPTFTAYFVSSRQNIKLRDDDGDDDQRGQRLVQNETKMLASVFFSHQRQSIKQY